MFVDKGNFIWDKTLKEFYKKNNDIFFHSKYFEIFEYSGYGTATAYIDKEDDKILFIPFLKNKIDSKLSNNEDLYDMQSPYGYSGIITNSNSVSFLDKSISKFINLCKKEKIICAFFRDNPLTQSFNEIKGLKKYFNVEFNRKINVLNLDQGIEDIWDFEFSSNCRNMVRKSLNKYKYNISNQYSSYRSLIKFYIDNMKELKAEKYYFFNDKFFKKFYTNLKNNFFIVEARNTQNEIIASVLILFSDKYGHYMFSCRNKKFQDNSVVNSLIFHSIKELCERKISLFNLGGGITNSTNDSLFKFKSKFTKNSLDYNIASKIFIPEKYSDVCNLWKKKYHNAKTKHSNKILRYHYYE